MPGGNHSQEGITQSDIAFGAELLLTIYAADIVRDIFVLRAIPTAAAVYSDEIDPVKAGLHY